MGTESVFRAVLGSSVSVWILPGFASRDGFTFFEMSISSSTSIFDELSGLDELSRAVFGLLASVSSDFC